MHVGVAPPGESRMEEGLEAGSGCQLPPLLCPPEAAPVQGHSSRSSPFPGRPSSPCPSSPPSSHSWNPQGSHPSTRQLLPGAASPSIIWTTTRTFSAPVSLFLHAHLHRGSTLAYETLPPAQAPSMAPCYSETMVKMLASPVSQLSTTQPCLLLLLYPHDSYPHLTGLLHSSSGRPLVLRNV